MKSYFSLQKYEIRVTTNHLIIRIVYAEYFLIANLISVQPFLINHGNSHLRSKNLRQMLPKYYST